MNINNFKISTKLTLGFGLMAVLLFLISATSLWKAKNLHDDFESVIHQQYPKVVKIEEIKDLLNTNEVSISHMLHYKESASHEDLIEKVLATRAKIAEALQFLQTQEMDAEEQAILEAFKGPRLDVASRTIIWSLIEQLRVSLMPLFHGLHRCFAVQC